MSYQVNNRTDVMWGGWSVAINHFQTSFRPRDLRTFQHLLSLEAQIFRGIKFGSVYAEKFRLKRTCAGFFSDIPSNDFSVFRPKKLVSPEIIFRWIKSAWDCSKLEMVKGATGWKKFCTGRVVARNESSSDWTEKTRRDRLSQVLFFQSRKFCSRIKKKKRKKTLAKKSLECEQ